MPAKVGSESPRLSKSDESTVDPVIVCLLSIYIDFNWTSFTRSFFIQRRNFSKKHFPSEILLILVLGNLSFF